MFFKLLPQLLYIGARDYDSRANKAARAVLDEEMTEEEAQKKFNVSKKAIDTQKGNINPPEKNYNSGANPTYANVVKTEEGKIRLETTPKYSDRGRNIAVSGVVYQGKTYPTGNPNFVPQAAQEDVRKQQLKNRQIKEANETRANIQQRLLEGAGYQTTQQKGYTEAVKSNRKIIIDERRGVVADIPTTAKYSRGFSQQLSNRETYRGPVQEKLQKVDNRSAEQKKFEEDVMKQRERQEKFFGSEGFRRIDQTASFLTFGGGKPKEDRSWFGQYSQTVVGGFMSFPLALGGSLVMTGEKLKLTYEGYKLGYGENIKNAYKDTFSDKDFKEQFDIRTPEGATTWTFVAAGGIAKGYSSVKSRALSVPKETWTQGRTAYRPATKMYYDQNLVRVDTPKLSGTFASKMVSEYKVTLPQKSFTSWQRVGKGYRQTGIRFEEGSKAGTQYATTARTVNTGYTYRVITKTSAQGKTVGEIYGQSGRYIGQFKGKTNPNFVLTEEQPLISQKYSPIDVKGKNLQGKRSIQTSKGVRTDKGGGINKLEVTSDVRSVRYAELKNPEIKAAANLYYDLAKNQVTTEPYFLGVKNQKITFVEYPPKPRINTLEMRNIKPDVITEKTQVGTVQGKVNPTFRTVQETRAYTTFKGYTKTKGSLLGDKKGVLKTEQRYGVYAESPSSSQLSVDYGSIQNLPSIKSSPSFFAANIGASNKSPLSESPKNISEIKTGTSNINKPATYLRTYPKIRSIQEPIITSISKTEVKPRSEVRSRADVRIKSDVRAETKTKTQIKTRVDTQVKTQVKTKTKTQTAVSEIAPSPKINTFGRLSVTPTITGGIFGFPKNTKTIFLKSKSFIGISQPKSYSPSGASVVFGIKGVSSSAGIKTGLGIRPILEVFSSKKKKKGDTDEFF